MADGEPTRRWDDDRIMRAVRVGLWPALLALCLLLIGNAYASMNARLAAAETRIEATDRSVVKMEATIDADSKSRSGFEARIETCIKGISERLDRLVERGNPK